MDISQDKPSWSALPLSYPGPAGAGPSTLSQLGLQSFGALASTLCVVTATTSPPRLGDAEGRDVSHSLASPVPRAGCGTKQTPGEDVLIRWVNLTLCHSCKLPIFQLPQLDHTCALRSESLLMQQDTGKRSPGLGLRDQGSWIDQYSLVWMYCNLLY